MDVKQNNFLPNSEQRYRDVMNGGKLNESHTVSGVLVLTPDKVEDESSKAFVCYGFPVFRLIGEYILLHRFHPDRE